MRLRSLAPVQRWVAGPSLVEESGDALLTNQVMQSVTNLCAKEGSDARTNKIASHHHATPKVPQSLVFPTKFLPPRVHDGQFMSAVMPRGFRYASLFI